MLFSVFSKGPGLYSFWCHALVLKPGKMPVIKYIHKKKFVSVYGNMTHYGHTDKIKVSEKEPRPGQRRWLGVAPQSVGSLGEPCAGHIRGLQVPVPQRGAHKRQPTKVSLPFSSFQTKIKSFLKSFKVSEKEI